MKTGLIGYGYWGKIIDSKLENNILSPPFDSVDWMFIATPPNTHYDLVKEYILKQKYDSDKFKNGIIGEYDQVIDLYNEGYRNKKE